MRIALMNRLTAYPILTGCIALALWVLVAWRMSCDQIGVLAFVAFAAVPAVVITELVKSRREGDRWWGTVLWVVVSLVFTVAALLFALLLVIGHQGCIDYS